MRSDDVCEPPHDLKERRDLGLVEDLQAAGVFVKSPVFPFVRFPGVDTILGPEMKSTGEVMGVGKTFGEAFVKAQLGAGERLPRPLDADGKPTGKVFLTVKNSDKPRAVEVARQLHAMGFPLIGTKGTSAAITAAGIPCETVNKVTEGRPHVVDMIKNNEIVMVINTVEERNVTNVPAQRLFLLQLTQAGGVGRGNVDGDVVGHRVDLVQAGQVVEFGR